MEKRRYEDFWEEKSGGAGKTEGEKRGLACYDLDWRSAREVESWAAEIAVQLLTGESVVE